jgi:hypothetical protein
LARALDVQAVFAQISEVTRSVPAHDYLTLGLLSPDRLGFKMHASSLGVVSEAPEYRVTSEREAERLADPGCLISLTCLFSVIGWTSLSPLTDV